MLPPCNHEPRPMVVAVADAVAVGSGGAGDGAGRWGGRVDKTRCTHGGRARGASSCAIVCTRRLSPVTEVRFITNRLTGTMFHEGVILVSLLSRYIPRCTRTLDRRDAEP